MVVFMEIVNLVLFSVDNNSCIIHISHEVGLILYIIQIVSCDTTIDNVYYNSPYFYVFVICSWIIP